MNKRFFLFLIFCIVATYGNELFAAGMGMGPPSPPCGNPPFPPCAVPIDGGLAFLAGAGILFGGRKLLKTSAKKS